MVKLVAEKNRLDDAARAGWLYYVAGNTQDEIAKKLGVSRQSAQRLVSMAVSEKLIKFRLDHPIAKCMELASQLRQEFGLDVCEVVPSDPQNPDFMTGAAIAGASEMLRWLEMNDSKVIGLGTGRMLRACVEQLPKLSETHHHLVSLVGNMMQDGSATAYNVVVRMAEKIGARHNPMPLTVLVRKPDELPVLHAQEPVAQTLNLCAQADVTFVGIGHIDRTSPVAVDGVITNDESDQLVDRGAVGEIVGWVYDQDGRLLEGFPNDRVSSAPLRPNSSDPVIGIAVGESKTPAIRAAVKGGLINGLITDEAVAEELLNGL